MRSIAAAILAVLLASILIEPLVEMANVFREKLQLNAAVTNACRAAKDRALEYEQLRGLDAKVNPERFKRYFAEAFGDALNLTQKSDTGDEVTFTSDDGQFNDFTVTFDFSDETDSGTEQEISTVQVEAEANYKYKTKYLKMAEEAIAGDDYKLVSERKYILSVKN